MSALSCNGINDVIKVYEDPQPPIGILSISGGGTRSIISLKLIDELLKRLRCKAHEVFDVIGGTSAGAILAIALANGASTDEILKVYPAEMAKIFPPSWFGNIAHLINLKYSPTGLADVLKKNFGEKTLNDTLTEVAITAVKLSTGAHDTFSSTYTPSLLQTSAIRRATAAMTFLPSFEGYSDAGLSHNSPVFAANALTQKLPQLNTEKRKKVIFSIGTGCMNTDTLAQSKIHESGYRKVNEILNFQAHSSLLGLEQMAEQLVPEGHFFSFNVPISEYEYSFLDNAKPDYLKGLADKTDAWIKENDELFRAACKKIERPEGYLGKTIKPSTESPISNSSSNIASINETPLNIPQIPTEIKASSWSLSSLNPFASKETISTKTTIVPVVSAENAPLTNNPPPISPLKKPEILELDLPNPISGKDAQTQTKADGSTRNWSIFNLIPFSTKPKEEVELKPIVKKELQDKEPKKDEADLEKKGSPSETTNK